ncbi:hypothetical protein VB779_08785 [Haloarculaceae archaeon H-GB11]|nr:hypothetical protein [Haloarculaceae archaeon H-GB11]
MSQTETLTVRGTDVDITPLQKLPTGGRRVDVKVGEKQWRLDISMQGNREIVTTWRDGELADLDEPEWMDDLCAQLGRFE